MSKDDRDYFARREAEERQAAAEASSEQARAVHRKLADRYHELARGSAREIARRESPRPSAAA